jgi:hypothetical protein
MFYVFIDVFLNFLLHRNVKKETNNSDINEEIDGYN